MDTKTDSEIPRRGFLHHAVGAGACLAAVGCAGSSSSHEDSRVQLPGATPLADSLLRDHGLQSRILLLYEDCSRTLLSGLDFKPLVLVGAAQIVESYIERCHERFEEVYLFPRFVKSGTRVDLVEILRNQHVAGRRLTQDILGLGRLETRDNERNRKRLAESLSLYIRMARPHEARESTDLFPLLRNVVSRAEYDSLQEDFDREETKRFGASGYDAVGTIAGLEKEVGLYDLAIFTPP